MDPPPTGRRRLRHAFLTGVAVIVPSVITLVVLGVVFNAIYDYLDAFSSVIVPVLPAETLPVSREIAIEIAAPIVFVASILVLGIAVESTRYGELAVEYAHYGIEQIPGVGSVYQGFRQMSDAMLESDTGNFREVVLVEFPTEGAYALAFVTSEAPAAVADPADDGEMRSLFMPMAPNPVMGGHVVFVPERRIVDVDLTVEAVSATHYVSTATDRLRRATTTIELSIDSGSGSISQTQELTLTFSDYGTPVDVTLPEGASVAVNPSNTSA